MKERVINICNKIFAIGCLVVMILSIVSTIGFFVSFFIGAESAEVWSGFLHRMWIPHVALVSVVISVVGMIKLYVNDEQVFTMNAGE